MSEIPQLLARLTKQGKCPRPMSDRIQSPSVFGSKFMTWKSRWSGMKKAKQCLLVSKVCRKFRGQMVRGKTIRAYFLSCASQSRYLRYQVEAEATNSDDIRMFVGGKCKTKHGEESVLIPDCRESCCWRTWSWPPYNDLLARTVLKSHSKIP